MAVLQIGRAGFVDSLTIAGPQNWRVSGSRHRIDGVFKSTTLANTKAIRDVLLAQVGQVVPVTYDIDSSFDGFYRLLDADVDARHRLGSLQGVGLFDFRVDLELIGTYASTEFQGLISNQLHANDHGLIRSEVNFWHAPPIGALARTVGDTSGSTGEITRTGADGGLNVAVGIPDTSPQWTISPSAYYSGGCYVKVGGYTRAGVEIPFDPDDWELGNSLVRVTPGLTSSVSDGTFDVAHHDGTQWETAKDYEVLYATTSRVGAWDKMRVVNNTPEYACVELIADANEAGGNRYTRHRMTLAVRRGGLMVMGYYHYDGAATTWKIQRATTEASATVQPVGADSVMGVSATSDDASGNRYILASSKTVTADTTQGGLSFASTQGFDFMISSRINGSSSQTQDQAGNQCLQYIAVSNEQVRPIPR